MNKLTIRSLIADQPETVEKYDCEFKEKDGKYLLSYNQPLYNSECKTSITVDGNRAVMLRAEPYDTRLEFDLSGVTKGHYFTGIGIEPVTVKSTRVSVDKIENTTNKNPTIIEATETKQNDICEICGADISSDTSICHVCGKKI